MQVAADANASNETRVTATRQKLNLNIATKSFNLARDKMATLTTRLHRELGDAADDAFPPDLGLPTDGPLSREEVLKWTVKATKAASDGMSKMEGVYQRWLLTNGSKQLKKRKRSSTN